MKNTKVPLAHEKGTLCDLVNTFKVHFGHTSITGLAHTALAFKF